MVIRPTASDWVDPIVLPPVKQDRFERVQSPVDAAAYLPLRTHWDSWPANFQTPFADDPADAQKNAATPPAAAKDPCAAAAIKPLSELGISIAQPAGDLPTDQATLCWNQINQTAGPLAMVRCWPVLCYQWDATCFCHRPLYFEEINLERYGYQCDCCLQPFASAAHFFGTVPLMPYCMANECPGECVYTLGHYRPGSCPPLRWHWAPCDPLAAAAEGGVWTGLILAIP